MKKLAFFALASTLAFGAAAQDKQESVGVISGVKGAVTVSSAQAVKRAVNGMSVPDGASILVSSKGAATLSLNNGCTIALKGSEFVQVDASYKCEQIQAAVQPVFSDYKVAQAPMGGGIAPPQQNPGSGAGFFASGGVGFIVPAVFGVAALSDWNRGDSNRISGQ